MECEKILPFGVKIVIKCDSVTFFEIINDSIKIVRRYHNDHYDQENYIEPVRIKCIKNTKESNLKYNEFEIYVGEELIHKGKGPDETASYEMLSIFYMSIVSILEDVLNIWHDKIIEVQKKNNLKLKQLEKEGYNEILFTYYNFRSDKRAFFYLKKLAERYPNSKYMDKLKRVYRNGYQGWHRRSPEMVNKLDKEYDNENF